MKKFTFLLALSLFIQYTHAQSEKPKPVEIDMNDGLTDAEKVKNEARERIEGYRQRVLKGESMSALAKQYSEDPGSAKEGGIYRDVPRGMMVPEFEEAAFKLDVGGISEVFETQYGFHFVQVIAKKGETIDVRHILVKFK